MATKKEIIYIARPGIIAFEWTPMENYLVTSEKYRTGVNENNLILWDAKTDGKMIRAFEWNSSANDGAKSIKFDPEEKFCAR